MNHRVSTALAVALLAAAPTVALAQVAGPTSDCMSPDAAPAATAERTTFRSRGREVQGILYRPARPNGAGVVILHDREGIQRDLPRYEAQVGRLTSCGYTIVVPSYYDGGQPTSDDPLLNDKWLQVIDEAIKHLVRVPGIDPARIGVWGYGRGGTLALDNALDGIAAKAVVAVSAGARVDDVRNSPPILLIAGDHDPDSPLYRAEQLARDMLKKDVSVTVEPVPASLHEFVPSTWDEVFTRTKAFFDSRLAPAG